MSFTQSLKGFTSVNATWKSSDGLVQVSVYQKSIMDERGAWGWAYCIMVPANKPNVSIHYTFADPKVLIYAHTSDPLEVLNTLSCFISAWTEAHGYPESENRDLFPEILGRLRDYAEEMSIDLLDYDDGLGEAGQ